MNPLTQYLMIGKLIALLGAVAIICYQSSQIHRWHTHYESERAAHQRDIDTLNALAAQSKAQQRTVTKIVDHYVTVTKPEIEKQVERIREAPLPGNCKTPKEILDADI